MRPTRVTRRQAKSRPTHRTPFRVGYHPVLDADQRRSYGFDRLSPNWSHKDLSLVTGTPAAAGNLGAYEFTAEPTKHVGDR
jgi:hypothetical protein